MGKQQLITGCVLAALSVILGAFGAHAFQPTLEAFGRVATYETAVQYHMFHALGILLTGILFKTSPHKQLKIASFLFVFGTILFSGSLYVLALTNLTFLGAITPLGGLAFIGGWVVLIIYLIKNYSSAGF